MQKWEYRWINTSSVYIDGKKIAEKPFIDGKTLFEYINYLGSQGWELVSVIPGKKKTKRFSGYWFKRPVE